MEPPEVLAIHAVPHPNPEVRRVGVALDDPSVEQVWAGVIGPSALLVLRRLPALWCESEPAVVDMRELGQSLGLGRSLARSGRTWRTIERIVGFGMAHWLPGDELGVRTEPLKARSPDYPSGPARSTTSCSARTSTSSPSATPIGPPTPTGPSTPPASPPASTTSSTAAPPSRAASASNQR